MTSLFWSCSLVLEKEFFNITKGKNKQIPSFTSKVKNSLAYYIYIFLTYEIGNSPGCLSPSFTKHMKRNLVAFSFKFNFFSYSG